MSVRILDCERIATALSSSVFAAAALLFCLGLVVAPNYPDFIVGNVTWGAGAKIQDLVAGPVFIAVLFFAVTFFSFLIRRQGELFGAASSSELANQLVWWSLPGVAAIFGLVLGTNLDSKLIYISAAGAGFVAVGVAWNAVKRIPVSPAMLGLSAFAILLISLLPVEVALVLGRAPKSVIGEINLPRYATATYAVAAGGLAVGLGIAVWNIQRLIRLLPHLLLVGQVGLCVVYLTLVPARFSLPDGSLSKYETTVWLKILAVGMVLVGVVDVSRRFLRRSPTTDLANLLSPIAVFALLLGLRVGSTVAPHIGSDDYHFGESLIGWWMYASGTIPYVGYIPSHGLIDDDFTRFLSSVFYDGSAGSVPEVGRISFAVLAFGAFLSIYYASGSIGLAFVAIFFLGGRLSWFFLTPFICLWFSRALRSNPSRWLAVWILTSPIVILGAPAQGLLLVGSTGLLALFHIWRLWSRAEERAWVGIGTAFAITLILWFATPVGPMLLGAVRYVIENGPINQVAYGIPWSASWHEGVKAGFVFEAVRMSWVLVPLGCLALVVANRKDIFRNDGDILPVVVVLVFTLLLIPYSMGRIDPGGVSRAGVAAIFGWTVLLPIAMWRLLDSSDRLRIVPVVTVIGAVLSFAPLSFSNFVTAAAAKISVPPLRDGASIGLVNIGKASVQDEQWERLTKLSRLLDGKMGPGEAYLDLTSRNAQYFYLNRKPVISITAPYNMVPPAQQKRAVEELYKSLPRVALLEGANIIHDGGGLALRNPYLYRFVIDNYIPRFEEGFIVGYRKTDVDSDEVSQLDIPVRNITDENWDGGYHRIEAAVVVDDSALLSVMKVGDQVRIDDGDVRKVTRVWVGGNAVWLDGGGPIQQMGSGRPTKVLLVMSPQKLADYRGALFQRAFAQVDLQKIPVAWGRAAKVLEKKMNPVMSFGGIEPGLSQLVAKNAGRYTVDGVDPALSFDTSGVGLSGRDAGLLKFDFACREKAGEPRIQVFWWGDAHEGPLEEFSLKFTADAGTLIVPLDAFPTWLMLKKIKGVRIDLDNASACSVIGIKNLELHQRKFD